MITDLLGMLRIRLGALSMVALAVFASIEAVFAVPIMIDVYQGVWTLATVVSAILVLLRQPMKYRLLTIGAYVAFSLALGTLYIVPWTPRKPFVQDLGRIKAGMTEAQVKKLMSKYVHGTGQLAHSGHNGLSYPPPFLGQIADYPPRPTYGHFETVTSPTGELAFKDTLVFRHSRSSRFNCDLGVVAFRDGRVTGVVFLPD